VAPTPDGGGGLDLREDVKVGVETLGIELEGAWRKPPWPLKRDPSVTKHMAHLGLPTGERSSPILKPHPVEARVRENYPDVNAARCGQHIHVFPPASVGAGLKFERALIYTLSQWDKCDETMLRRLRGENFDGRPTWSYPTAPRGRWRAVNISHSKKKHGTVEIRILPMFATVDLALEAIALVLKVVAEWRDMVVEGQPEDWMTMPSRNVAPKGRRRR
jgi:hypothetical protein